MRAVQLTDIQRPLELRDVPVPVIGPGDVLVRIRAAGICHSDAHYRAGHSAMGPLPLTLGHEIAGVVEQVGRYVASVTTGDRVCLHYLRSCGVCDACSAGHEQFCVDGSMLGHHVDGGFAEVIVVPERNAIRLPEEIPFEHGAVMMCSSATSLHALRKSRFTAGETVAIFGTGGLGMSAVQIARALGALEVFAVDIDPEKLRVAESYGALPIDSSSSDPVSDIMKRTKGRGVDVSLELAGLASTTRQAVQSLAPFGRAVMVGITTAPVEVDTYRDLIGKEAEMIGSNDHLIPEIHLLLELARRGKIDLSHVIGATVPLESGPINDTLTRLEQFSSPVRTVVIP